MWIKFKAHGYLEEYHGDADGESISFKDGEVKNVHEQTAKRLLKEFKKNFSKAKAIKEPVVDRALGKKR